MKLLVEGSHVGVVVETINTKEEEHLNGQRL